MQKTRNKILFFLIFLVGFIITPNSILAESFPDEIKNIYELRDYPGSLNGYNSLRPVASDVGSLGYYLGTSTQYLPYKISASTITNTGRDATVTGVDYAVYCTYFGQTSPAQNSYISYCVNYNNQLSCSATAIEQQKHIPASCTKQSGWDEGTRAGVAYIIKQAGGRTFAGTNLGNYYNAESTINQFLYAITGDICNIQKCNADSTGGTNDDNKITTYNETDVKNAKAIHDAVNTFNSKGALTINAPTNKELTYDDTTNIWKSERFTISNFDKYSTESRKMSAVLKDANGNIKTGYAYITTIGNEVQVGVCNNNESAYCNNISNFKELTAGNYTIEVTVEGNYSYDVAQNYNCGTSFQSITPAFTDTVNTNEKQTTTFNLKVADEPGTIKIIKVDADTNEEVTGATITIKGKNNNFVKTVILTNRSTVTIKNLEYGTYEITENRAPEGYEKDTRTYEVVISKTNLVEEVVISNKQVEQKLGTFSLIKIDESGNKLGGSTFKYYYGDNEMVTLNISNKGLKFTNVNFNEKLCLEETKSPTSYKLNSKKFCFEILDTGEIKLDENYNFVKLTKNNSLYTINVINYPEDKSIVKIKKVDSKDKTKLLTGAKLHIIDESGKEVVEPWITTNEEFVITGLNNGKYYVEEIEAPEGYTLNKTKQEFTIESNNTQLVLEFVNEKPIDVPNTLSNISKLIILLAVTGILVGAILVYKNKFSEDGIK